jgi:DNA polymerase-3 subunit alpha
MTPHGAPLPMRDIFGGATSTPSSWTTASTSSGRPSATCCGWPRISQLPLVATNDLHYTKAEDATAHAALLCVQSGSTLMDPGPVQVRRVDEFYLKTPRRCATCSSELPEACDNTLLIAERAR